MMSLGDLLDVELVLGFDWSSLFGRLHRFGAALAQRKISLSENLMPESQVKEHVLVSGSSGLVGSALVKALSAQGHRVTRLIHGDAGRSSQDSIHWDATGADSENRELREFLSATPVNIVVHLAGAPIFSLWTHARKKMIRDSRVIGTQRLALALANAPRKPRVMV